MADRIRYVDPGADSGGDGTHPRLTDSEGDGAYAYDGLVIALSTEKTNDADLTGEGDLIINCAAIGATQRDDQTSPISLTGWTLGGNQIIIRGDRQSGAVGKFDDTNYYVLVPNGSDFYGSAIQMNQSAGFVVEDLQMEVDGGGFGGNYAHICMNGPGNKTKGLMQRCYLKSVYTGSGSQTVNCGVSVGSGDDWMVLSNFFEGFHGTTNKGCCFSFHSNYADDWWFLYNTVINCDAIIQSTSTSTSADRNVVANNIITGAGTEWFASSNEPNASTLWGGNGIDSGNNIWDIAAPSDTPADGDTGDLYSQTLNFVGSGDYNITAANEDANPVPGTGCTPSDMNGYAEDAYETARDATDPDCGAHEFVAAAADEPRPVVLGQGF